MEQIRITQKSNKEGIPTDETTMNITLRLNKVQEEQLKEVLKRDKKTYSQKGGEDWFLDYLSRRYING